MAIPIPVTSIAFTILIILDQGDKSRYPRKKGSPPALTGDCMKSLVRIILLLITSLLFISARSYAAQCKVTYVFDGDTLLCRLSDISIKVRLAGIDAPETSNNKTGTGQRFGQQAKKYLAKKVLNRVVFIKRYGLDTYNRILGELFIDSKNVNLEMIQMGLAEVYKGELPEGFGLHPFIAAEKEAKEKLKGIWSLGDRYISPSRWRRETQ
jgi:micrococcal nuclease